MGTYLLSDRGRSGGDGLREIEAEYRLLRDVARRDFMQEEVEIPALIEALELPTGARVLEVGCGRGVALPALARLCKPERLVGIDIDPGLLDEASHNLDAKGAKAELVCGDVRRMPFAANSFDVVVDFGTCYYVARPHEVIQEIGRVLDIGGVLIHEPPVDQLRVHPAHQCEGDVREDAPTTRNMDNTAVLWSWEAA